MHFSVAVSRLFHVLGCFATYLRPTAAFFRWVFHRRNAIATIAIPHTMMEPVSS